MKVAVLIACLVAATLAVHQKPQQSFLCDVCRFMGQEINMRMLDDDTKEMVLETAQEVCDLLPSSLKSKCSATITEYGSDVVDEIFKSLDLAPYCEKMEIFPHEYLCPQNATLEAAPVESDGGCRACKDSLDMLKMLLSSEDMKDLIHVAINQTCSAIGGDTVEMCETMVTNVVDEILGNILPMFDVGALCRFAGACPAPQWMAGKASDVECLLCKDGFGILEGILASSQLSDIMDIAINQTCTAIGIGQNRCLDIGSFLKGQLIDTLKELATPSFVCGQIGVCPAVAKTLNVNTYVEDNEGCKACMDAFDLIQAILKADETEDLVHIAVNEFCIAVAGAQSDTCAKLIEGVVDPILKQLIFLFDPATLCKKAGACVNLLMVDADSAVCDICIDGIQEIRNIAADKEVADMLSKITDVVCNSLKIPFCKVGLNGVIKEALQGLQNLNPNATCATLNACPKFFLENDVEGGPLCTMCTMASNAIINGIVKNKQFHTLVNEAITLICKVWPGDECPQILDEVFETMIKALEAFGGQGMCSIVGLC